MYPLQRCQWDVRKHNPDTLPNVQEAVKARGSLPLLKGLPHSQALGAVVCPWHTWAGWWWTTATSGCCRSTDQQPSALLVPQGCVSSCIPREIGLNSVWQHCANEGYSGLNESVTCSVSLRWLWRVFLASQMRNLNEILETFVEIK